MLSHSFFQSIHKLSLQEIAYEVAYPLLSDEIPEGDLRNIIKDAINFEAPVVKIEENIHVLELFHGPTLAFKDFGARFMARVMGYFLPRQSREINILVATSGDTGSAVGHGFLNVPGIKVTILYPKGKVSEIQEKQLTTIGGNITAIELEGTFDDCQSLAKQAFLDKELNKSIHLTSANSINICRLIPQSFYYFFAYAQLSENASSVVFSVPSGNFGNLCGGLLAKKIGLPVEKFIAATNINKIFPEYLNTGKYNPQPSIQTIANAMDVGNPSNFARVKEIYGNRLEEIKKDIDSYFFSDEQLKQAIKQVYQQNNYLMCPHTAAGYLGIKNYLKNKRVDATEGIFLSTAHPAKFLDIIEEVIDKRVEIPIRLQQSLDKQKSAITLPNNFRRLKNYLLDRN